MTLKQLMALDGIRTGKDIDGKKRASESRHAFLVRSYGEVNADRIMRAWEVSSWDFSRPMGAHE
jgi:hypothetical protein